jgi:TonB family protein
MTLRAVFISLFLVGVAIAQNAAVPPANAVPTCRGNDGDRPGCLTPPHAIYSPCPMYDDASRKAKIEGTVRVQIIVMRDGQIKDPKVISSLSEALDQRTVDAVSKWKFEPATKDGKPAATAIAVECTFKLK